ncbi:MAG TPA: DUF2007 domain-containing protein [Clostridia bacterium]|jgi:hypothetical protein|nr:DUF2007 domain-containing protein [Clostridia bacterium]HHY06553.1 DUF2007 domain-containing protein [Clostridia bacterium]
MWTVVYIAPNKVMAEQLKSLLENEGILVMLRSVGVPHLGDSGAIEVLVPETEAEEASQILTYSAGNSPD